MPKLLKNPSRYILIKNDEYDVHLAESNNADELWDEAERLNAEYEEQFYAELASKPKGKGRPAKIGYRDIHPYHVYAFHQGGGERTGEARDESARHSKREQVRNPELKNLVALDVAKRLDRAYFEVELDALTALEKMAVRYYPEIFSIERNYNNHTDYVSLKDVNYREMLSKKNGILDNQSETFNADKLDTLSAEFQGQITGEVFEAPASDYAPNELARLGQLVTIKTRNGYDLNFKGDAWLCADARKNLWVVGKSAKVKGVKNPKKAEALQVIGEIEQIDYITDKQHIEGGNVTHYYHELGEVDGQKPFLAIDKDSFPVILGGNYDIWNVGIVN